MTWLALLRLLLALAVPIAETIRDRKLIGAGEAEAVAKALKESMNAIKRAQAARRAVDHSTDGVRLDPRNRD